MNNGETKSTPVDVDDLLDSDGVVHITRKLKEIPVEIDGDDYVLREFDGDARDAYLDQMRSNVRINPKTGEVMGLKRYKGTMAELIAPHLFEVGSSDPVSKRFVQNLPSSQQGRLAEICSKLSGLATDSEDEAKND